VGRMGGSPRKRLIACLLVLGVAVLVGLKIQSVSAQTKTFTGCLTSTGAMNRIAIGTAPTKPCGADTEISWTSTGPQGPPGPTGSPGTIGVEGQSCPSGEALEGFDSNGEICAVP
jgi:hypothetical protein